MIAVINAITNFHKVAIQILSDFFQETPDIMEGAMPLLQVSKAIVGISKASNPVKPVGSDLN